jgi:ABC-2 type transport system ATP-binding protein
MPAGDEMDGSDNVSMVVFEDVGKNYGKVQALSRASFDIREGEVLGFIGPNGAGKTTTIRMLVGLLEGYTGTIKVSGVPLEAGKDRVHRMLGYLPQQVAFQDWKTVEQTLQSFGRLSGLSPDKLGARIDEVLRQVGLYDVKQRKVSALSGGMVQRLGLAQAILHGPKLLVMDEPLVGLDPENRYNVKRIIQELNRSGMTVFFSSHILSDVEDIASRILIVDKGRILWTGTVDRLKSSIYRDGVIDLTVSQDPGRMGEVALLPGVARVDQPSLMHYHICLREGADQDAVFQKLISGLPAMGYRITSITSHTPTLEEAYMRFLSGGVC